MENTFPYEIWYIILGFSDLYTQQSLRRVNKSFYHLEKCVKKTDIDKEFVITERAISMFENKASWKTTMFSYLESYTNVNRVNYKAMKIMHPEIVIKLKKITYYQYKTAAAFAKQEREKRRLTGKMDL